MASQTYPKVSGRCCDLKPEWRTTIDGWNYCTNLGKKNTTSTSYYHPHQGKLVNLKVMSQRPIYAAITLGVGFSHHDLRTVHVAWLQESLPVEHWHEEVIHKSTTHTKGNIDSSQKIYAYMYIDSPVPDNHHHVHRKYFLATDYAAVSSVKQDKQNWRDLVPKPQPSKLFRGILWIILEAASKAPLHHAKAEIGCILLQSSGPLKGLSVYSNIYESVVVSIVIP